MQGGVSLIAGLERTIAMEYLCEENEAALHYVPVFLSFPILSDLRKVSLLQVRLLASYMKLIVRDL